jgi:anti-sigma factor RsiW
MATHHPDDLTLLAYAEEELTAVERGTLAAHVAACAECADRVRLLETGRDALRAAPLLELPEARRQALLHRLPERRDWLSFLEPFRVGLRRAVPALAALVLVAGIVALATQVDLGGDDQEPGGEAAQVAEEEAGGGGEAEGAQTDATRQQEAAGDADLPQQFLGGTLVRQVQGPPRAVARLLRQIGYPAQVQEGAVVVSADTVEEITVLLEPRADGPVPVYVR